jgi:hypothetical protein
VARGNDGNLLQHGTEAELATRLAREGELHLVCTHGMAPFEPWENPGRNDRIVRWLNRITQPAAPEEPVILRAYRLLNTSAQRYPNTGEIVAALLSRSRLTGFISEVCQQKIGQLHQAWRGTDVVPLLGSWRQLIGTIRATVPDRPWLFTMDPMSFFPDQGVNDDDNRLYPLDFYASLRPLWETFFASNQPGAVSIFCFELMRGPGTNRYLLFLETTKALSRNLGVDVGYYEVS